MRVHTYHTQTVSRTSTMLGGLLSAHLVFSFFFTIPVACTYLGIRWGKEWITSNDRVWMLALLLVWIIIEVVRFVLGTFANRKMRMADLSWFGALTLVPQLVINIVNLAALKELNDLEFAMYITQIILLGLETICVWPLVARLVRNNTVDFYTVLGGGPPRLPIGIF